MLLKNYIFTFMKIILTCNDYTVKKLLELGGLYTYKYTYLKQILNIRSVFNLEQRQQQQQSVVGACWTAGGVVVDGADR